MRRKIELLKVEQDEFEKEKAMLIDKTNSTKESLIRNLKGNLGNEIKKNPNNIKVIKKTRFQRFIIFIKSIFTKF